MGIKLSKYKELPPLSSAVEQFIEDQMGFTGNNGVEFYDTYFKISTNRVNHEENEEMGEELLEEIRGWFPTYSWTMFSSPTSVEIYSCS